MPVVTSESDLHPLTKYEPYPPRTASAKAIPVQQRPPGQLSLELWSVPRLPEGEPTEVAFDRKKFVAILTALVEVYDGSRPISQVQKALHPSVYRELVARSRRPGPRYRLRTAHARQPRHGAIEGCGLLHTGDRALAVCTRFEQGEHGWLCTEFTVMEQRGPCARQPSGT